MVGKILIFSICVLMSSFFCNTNKPKESTRIGSTNIDSLFIQKYLPEIRDALCADTLTVKKIKSIFKKTINYYPDGDEYLSLDTIDSYFNHIRASICVDSISRDKIRRIDLHFPDDVLCIGEREMTNIFGKFTPDKTPRKLGMYGKYKFGLECNLKVVVRGLFVHNDCINQLIMYND